MRLLNVCKFFLFIILSLVRIFLSLMKMNSGYRTWIWLVRIAVKLSPWSASQTVMPMILHATASVWGKSLNVSTVNKWQNLYYFFMYFKIVLANWTVSMDVKSVTILFAIVRWVQLIIGWSDMQHFTWLTTARIDRPSSWCQYRKYLGGRRKSRLE